MCVNRCYFLDFRQNCCLWPLCTLLCPFMTSDASDKVLDCLDMLTNTKSRVRSDVGWLGITLMGVWKKCFYRCSKCFYRCNRRVYLIIPCVSVCELVREWHVQNLDPSQLSSNTHITLIWCSTHSVGVRSGGKSLGVTGGTSPWGSEWFWVVTQIKALLTLRPKVTLMGTRVRVYEW